jgi:hypothetical protein
MTLVGKTEIAWSAPARADEVLQVDQASGTWHAFAKSGQKLTSFYKFRQRRQVGGTLSGWSALVSVDKA